MLRMNKKALLLIPLFIILSSLSFAITEDAGWTLGSGVARSWNSGSMIIINESINITSIVKHPLDTSVLCTIYANDNVTLIASGTFSTDTCAFGSGVILNGSTVYHIQSGNGTTQYNERYDTVAGVYPFDTGRITWLNASYNDTVILINSIRHYSFDTINYELIVISNVSFSKVKITNKWNGSNLTGVNVSLSNGLSNLTDSIGVASFLNLSGNFSFNATLSNYFNISGVTIENSTVTFNMSQSVINVSINRSFINDQVCNFSLSHSILGIVLNTSGCSGLIYPNADTWNFTVIDNTGTETFSSDNTSLLVNALDNKSVTLTVFGHFININATNIIDGTAINVFNVNVTALNFTSLRQLNTTNGLIAIPVVDGDYNITIDAENFSLSNNTVIIRVNNSQINLSHNFRLYTTNSVNITFRDIDTNNLLSGINVTIEFIGLTSQTNTTNTSFLYVDLLTPDEYTLISNADGYRQNSYITTIINRGFTNFTIYLTKTNDTQLVLIKVRDEFNSPIKNSIVTIQRYIDNIWKTDQILKTDFNGQTEGYYVISTEFYNHLVELSGSIVFGIINSNTNKKVIYAEDVTNGITITANVLEDSSLPAFQNTEGDISISLNYTFLTNSTGFFSYRAIDNNGLQHAFELKVNKGGELVSVCDNSSFQVSDTSSAIITCNVNETGDRTVYIASGFIDNFNKITISEVVGEKSGRQIDWGVTGYIMAFFLLVVIYFSYLASPTLSLWLGTIFFIGFTITGIIFKDMNIGVLSVLVVLTYLVANMKSQGGVNA